LIAAASKRPEPLRLDNGLKQLRNPGTKNLHPMRRLEETLKRLAITFTVRDIMIPVSDLVCAPDESQAAAVSAEHPDFSVIPIPDHGKLTSYFERDSRSTKKITLNDLISDGTSLLDLVQILEGREFSFVLSQHIEGYVHFSDLNNHLVACRSEFVTADATGGVRVFPLDGASIGGVGVDIAAELAS
jgi:hypothetical protein